VGSAARAMTQSLEVGALFAAHEHPLGLEWVAGRAGAQRALQPRDPRAPHTAPPFIGYMNCIHPPRIHVIGAKELDYLHKLGKNSHADVVSHLFAEEPVAIIVADDLKPPSDLRRAAEDNGTPLWTARVAAHELIERLGYYLKSTFAQHVTQHGVFMEIVGVGVLITGASGIGKSELALDLLSRGHRLIADDAPEFYRAEPDVVIGTCPPLLCDFLEARGLGVLNIRAMFGESAVKQSERLQLIVELVKVTEEELAKLERLGTVRRTRDVMGVPVAHVTLPVTPGRNLSVVVECAARNQILLNQGYDALEKFVAQQRASMEQPAP
jgi:HPr kinase/phosphorylase